MGQLTAEGYVAQNATDLMNEMQGEAVASVIGYTGLPSELQTNLIQEGSIIGLKMEAGISNLLNGVAPEYANDFIFQQFGQSLSLPMNGAITTQVTVAFTGPASTYIPANYSVSNGGTTIVTTMTDGIIPVSGSVSILCQTTQQVAIAPGTLTTMLDPITGVTVTNAAAGIEGVAAETIDPYRARVQTALQSPRNGSVGLAYTLLNKVPGVNPLLIFFNYTTIPVTIGGSLYAFRGIQAVVGGGDDNAVALALFKAFMETKNLISSPVSGTTVTKTITVFNSSFPVSFTRPAAATLEIDLTIVLQNASTSQTMAQQLLATAYTNFLAGLTIGTVINLNKLNEVLYTTMETINILPENLKTITYAFKINGSPVSPSAGNLPLNFDQYAALSALTLAIS